MGKHTIETECKSMMIMQSGLSMVRKLKVEIRIGQFINIDYYWLMYLFGLLKPKFSLL